MTEEEYIQFKAACDEFADAFKNFSNNFNQVVYEFQRRTWKTLLDIKEHIGADLFNKLQYELSMLNNAQNDEESKHWKNKLNETKEIIKQKEYDRRRTDTSRH